MLATDAHDDQHRKPILSEAGEWVAQHFGADLARRLVEDNPAAIVAGEPLPDAIAPEKELGKAVG